MKKMIITTLIIVTMLTGCGKEEKVNTLESEAVVETVQSETKETEAKVSDEYLAELEYNSQTNGF